MPYERLHSWTLTGQTSESPHGLVSGRSHRYSEQHLSSSVRRLQSEHVRSSWSAIRCLWGRSLWRGRSGWGWSPLWPSFQTRTRQVSLEGGHVKWCHHILTEEKAPFILFCLLLSLSHAGGWSPATTAEETGYTLERSPAWCRANTYSSSFKNVWYIFTIWLMFNLSTIMNCCFWFFK